ncbi:RNA polymerase sigma-70 factor [Carboxylicivirga sp. RSCT41]|uniref:RNA polymerase sigma-70 factor n=1 Tax=Carboxylicivirga agarovorans TaxID=3417570 RepID=UPI003D333BC6
MNQTIKPQFNNGNIERHEGVYEYLFNTYYARLCSYAMRYVERKDQAEDIVSDTFYKMWQKGNIKISTSIQSYLFQAVYNNCMYFLRQQSNERTKRHHIQNQFETNHTSQLLEDFTERDSLILKEVEEAVDEAIEKLPVQAKKVFSLKRFKGYKNKEVASELNISIKTVEMHMARALKFLHSELKDFCPILLSLYLSLFQ